MSGQFQFISKGLNVMDLHGLQVFRAVATEKSFSRAAAAAGPHPAGHLAGGPAAGGASWANG